MIMLARNLFIPTGVERFSFRTSKEDSVVIWYADKEAYPVWMKIIYLIIMNTGNIQIRVLFFE